jgi:hypothetical protein
VIPHFYNGHKKSFFQAAYEGWRHPSQVTITNIVPSTTMKNGDFSKYVNPGPGGANLFTGLTNPYTGGTYGTSIPTISSIAANTLKTFYPDPNKGDPTAYTSNGVANYIANLDSSAHSNQFDVRGDQYFGSNQKFLLWGRYTMKNFPRNTNLVLNLPSSVYLNQNKSIKIDTNWSITPHLINEGGYGFTRYNSGLTNPFDGHAWTVAQNFVGLQNLYYNGIPEMDFKYVQSLNADRLTQINKSNTYDYADVLMWTKGKHNFKLGTDILTMQAITPLGFNGADNYGSYTFNTSGATGMFTGVDFADFLIGAPNQTFYDVVSQDNFGIAAVYNFFVQDEWRVTSKLALSYGVRYEIHPPYYDKYGDIGNFDPTVAKAGKVIYTAGSQNLIAKTFMQSANACDPDGVTATNSATVNGAPCMQVVDNNAAGLPKGLKTYSKERFMPRFGFAYRPFNNDKWSIRGGVGMYNITLLGSNFYSLTGTIQAYTQQYTNTYNSSTHAIGYQWPNIDAAAAGGTFTPNYGGDYFGTANSVQWKDPYTEQWSIGIDHDFGAGYAARVSYVGEETHQLVWSPDENTLPYSSTVSATNQPFSARLFPNWGRINTRATGDNESYNSLQLSGSHRMQHGLQFSSELVWAKALASNQGPSGTSFAGETGGGRSSSILSRRTDFGNVFGIRRLRSNSNALYDLPFGRGKTFGSSMSRGADRIVGGWRLSAIMIWQTGPYETAYFPAGQGDPSGTGSGLNSTASGWDPGHRDMRPDLVAGVSVNPTTKNRYTFVNPAAFTCPGLPSWSVGANCTTGSGAGAHPLPIGRFGNNQVGTVEGPHMFNLSGGVTKTIPVTSRIKVKIEGTFTNVLNHTNLGNPNMDLSSSSFGLIPKAIASDFGGARTGQISIRGEF